MTELQEQVKKLSDKIDAATDGFSNNVIMVALANVAASHIRIQDPHAHQGMVDALAIIVRANIAAPGTAQEMD